MMWPTKQTMVLQELQNMGPDKIAEIKITADDNGIPTKIEGFNLDVIPGGLHRLCRNVNTCSTGCIKQIN